MSSKPALRRLKISVSRDEDYGDCTTYKLGKATITLSGLFVMCIYPYIYNRDFYRYDSIHVETGEIKEVNMKDVPKIDKSDKVFVGRYLYHADETDCEVILPPDIRRLSSQFPPCLSLIIMTYIGAFESDPVYLNLGF